MTTAQGESNLPTLMLLVLALLLFLPALLRNTSKKIAAEVSASSKMQTV